MNSALRIVLAGVLAVSVVACGSGSSSPSAPSVPNNTPPTSDANTVVVTITSNNGSLSFSPNPATIAAGQNVIWYNAASETHHVVLNDGSIDTGDLAPGAASAAMAWTAGVAQYHCALHPSMVGSVNDQTAPPSTPCDGCY